MEEGEGRGKGWRKDMEEGEVNNKGMGAWVWMRKEEG